MRVQIFQGPSIKSHILLSSTGIIDLVYKFTINIFIDFGKAKSIHTNDLPLPDIPVTLTQSISGSCSK